MINFPLSLRIKLFLVVLLAISSFSLFMRVARSEDFTVVCDNSGCSGPAISIFNESAILPGESFTRTLAVQNDRSKDIALKLSAGKKSTTDDIFLNVLDVVVKNSDNSLINSLGLADFLSGTKIDLGNVVVGAKKSLIITINFDKNAGNAYQAKKAVFDILFEITGDDIQAPDPTPTATPLTNGGGDGGTGGTSVEPTSTPTSGLVAGLATRFLSEVFGVTDEEDLEKGIVETGVVQGLAACQDKYFRWWWPLAVQALVVLVLFFVNRKKKWPFKILIVGVLVLGIISQIIHWILGCNCATGVWCPRYVYLNLALTLLAIATQIRSKR